MLSFKVFHFTHKVQFLASVNKTISPKRSKGVKTLDLNSLHVASLIVVCCKISIGLYFFHFTLRETFCAQLSIEKDRQSKVTYRYFILNTSLPMGIALASPSTERKFLN